MIIPQSLDAKITIFLVLFYLICTVCFMLLYGLIRASQDSGRCTWFQNRAPRFAVAVVMVMLSYGAARVFVG